MIAWRFRCSWVGKMRSRISDRVSSGEGDSNDLHSGGPFDDGVWESQVSKISRTTRSSSPRAGGTPSLDVPKSMTWSWPERKYEVVRVWRRDSSNDCVIGHGRAFSELANASSSPLHA